MCNIITNEAKLELANVISMDGKISVTVCSKFTKTVVDKILNLLEYVKSIWNLQNTEQSKREINLYFVLCYYNGREVPKELNVPGLKIHLEPEKKFESPLYREENLMAFSDYMGLFKAGPDSFGFQTVIEESPFLLQSEVARKMISAIYESISIDSIAVIEAIQFQASTKSNIYDKNNFLEISKKLFDDVYNHMTKCSDQDYKKSLIYIVKSFDELAIQQGLNVTVQNYDQMTILQLISAIESHVDIYNPNGLTKAVLIDKEIKNNPNCQRLDDGITLQNYNEKTAYKPGYALGKLVVSTLSRKQLLGSRLDFEQFFHILNHMVYNKWPVTFAEAVNNINMLVKNTNSNLIGNIFHLQIQDGEADDMSYKIMGKLMQQLYSSFHFYSTWQISTGGNKGNELLDLVNNLDSEIRIFMDDDLYFADPDSNNQKAVLACLPNLKAYLDSKTKNVTSNVTSNL